MSTAPPSERSPYDATQDSRGRFTAAASATLASIAVINAPARAAQFAYKYASNVSVDHPLNCG